MRWRYVRFGDTEQYVVMKQKVNELFKRLRKEGIVARQNFMCCGGCAAAAMPEKREYVAYHRQDNERWLESGELLLLYGSWMDWNAPDREMQEALAHVRVLRVAEAIQRHAEALGLVHDWQGSTEIRISLRLMGTGTALVKYREMRASHLLPPIRNV